MTATLSSPKEADGPTQSPAEATRLPYKFYDMNDDTTESLILRRSFEAAGKFVYVTSFEIDVPDRLQ